MLINLQHFSWHLRATLGLMAVWGLLYTPVAVKAEGSSRSDGVVAEQATSSWRSMTREEEAQSWNYILNSPLGIAAFNQLAIEGFISPLCPKTFYTNEEFGGFQFLVRVECPDARGVSTAVGYREMRVIFNRFESNIENFSIERVGEETPPSIPLP